MGGGGGGEPRVVQTPPPQDTSGLGQKLADRSHQMLDNVGILSGYSSGAQLTPRGHMGQVYVPGPNPTIFGDPYSYAQHTPYFGPSSVAHNTQRYEQQSNGLGNLFNQFLRPIFSAAAGGSGGGGGQGQSGGGGGASAAVPNNGMFGLFPNGKMTPGG